MRICLDPGHGGHDPGAVSGGLDEKSVVLDLAHRLEAYLLGTSVGVILTRSDDRFVTLPDRCRIANETDVDLFVSLHCNASPPGGLEPFGSEVWIHAGSRGGRRLAAAIDAAMTLGLRGHASRGIKEASGLAVLRGTRMPAALVEFGFINGLHDRTLLAAPHVRQRWAEAIADALVGLQVSP